MCHFHICPDSRFPQPWNANDRIHLQWECRRNGFILQEKTFTVKPVTHQLTCHRGDRTCFNPRHVGSPCRYSNKAWDRYSFMETAPNYPLDFKSVFCRGQTQKRLLIVLLYVWRNGQNVQKTSFGSNIID